MNAALKLAQFDYDNRLPVELEHVAQREWIADGVEQLMRGADVEHGVSFERFAVAVDEFAMQQLSQPGISQSVLGRFILRAKFGSPAEARTAADELLSAPDPALTLREIAEGLLRPHATQAVIAQAENGAL